MLGYTTQRFSSVYQPRQSETTMRGSVISNNNTSGVVGPVGAIDRSSSMISALGGNSNNATLFVGGAAGGAVALRK